MIWNAIGLIMTPLSCIALQYEEELCLQNSQLPTHFFTLRFDLYCSYGIEKGLQTMASRQHLMKDRQIFHYALYVYFPYFFTKRNTILITKRRLFLYTEC